MRIKPVAFNYGEMKKEVPDLEVSFGRKNVVLKNDKYTMWGEAIDKEGEVMMLTSLALSREYSKGSKQDIFDEWQDFLHKFATDLPEEIARKIQARNEAAAKAAEEQEVAEAV